MWLINCENYQLEENDIDGPNPIPYFILSHTWGEDEVTFTDMTTSLDTAVHKKGFVKIRGVCDVALTYGCSHVWVDTCCIDKTSSAELTESINSMFHWYSKAEVCIVYLDDLTLTDGRSMPTEADLLPCRWFTRGWTLQELIAPEIISFYDRFWTFCGTKRDLLDAIHQITRVDLHVLQSPANLGQIPVGRKMSWAANRRSTRIEDTAYCLLGIFGIHMPLIYGEREKSFLRLQEHIAQTTNDMSLFAWKRPATEDMQVEYSGLLAKSPSWFEEAIAVEHSFDPVIPTPSWIITNAGLELHTALEWSQDLTGYRLYLHCKYEGVGDDDDPLVLSIWLRKTRSGFIRYKPSELSLTSQSVLTFGESALVRVATTLSPTDIMDTGSFYHPQSHLLNSSISFKWDNLRAAQLGFRFNRSYYPEHFWDSQRHCFFTSSSTRFVGLIEIKISRAASDSSPAWDATCFVVCGLMRAASRASGEADTPRPWLMPLRQHKDDSIEGLDGFKRSDLINPFMLSTIGFKLRSRFGGRPPSSGECVLQYADDGYLSFSVSVLSMHNQLAVGRTMSIIVTPVSISARTQ